MAKSINTLVDAAGVNTTYGGGAVFVKLQGTWYQIGPQFESQMLAVALAAVSSGKKVDASVGNTTGETGSSGEYMCFTLHMVA
jgi:hypothetical protein